jgi:radical SAM protein with 4Fe4S-binding SPASM domain
MGLRIACDIDLRRDVHMKILRVAAIAALVLAVISLCAAGIGSQSDSKAVSATDASKAPVKQSFCPPCGMKIDPKTSPSVEVQGFKIYVCSDYCGEKVKKDPAKYLKKIKDAGETPETVPAKEASAKSDACGKCPMKNACSDGSKTKDPEKK